VSGTYDSAWNPHTRRIAAFIIGILLFAATIWGGVQLARDSTSHQPSPPLASAPEPRGSDKFPSARELREEVTLEIDAIKTDGVKAGNALHAAYRARYPRCEFYLAYGTALSPRSAGAVIDFKLEEATATAPHDVPVAGVVVRKLKEAGIKGHPSPVEWFILAASCEAENAG